MKIGGLKESNEQPWYVAAKDLKQNVLIAAQGHEHPWLLTQELVAQQLTWIKGSPPSTQFKTKAKVRYRHQEAECDVEIDASNKARIYFYENQWAVTPGQSIVFYDGNICLGGGIIESTQCPGGIWY